MSARRAASPTKPRTLNTSSSKASSSPVTQEISIDASPIITSQKSPHDARVTLLSIEDPDSPRPIRKRSRPVLDDAEEKPSHQRKRNGSRKLLSQDIDEEEVKKESLLQTFARPQKFKASTSRSAKPTKHPPPPHWQETYQIIKQQREAITAPVDMMGCDQAGHHNAQAIAHLSPQSLPEKRLTCLVSLMLSSQTKDEITAQAVLNLRTQLKFGLTVDGLCRSSLEDIQKCIEKVGFWRRKAGYIKEVALVLRDKYDGDIPSTLEDLLALKGVGPKMAYLCLASAWGMNQGIGVDTHVHRITNRLGWHNPATKDPEQTRVNLEAWLPKDLNGEINHMLVGFGQVICVPVGPRCDLCDLAQEIPGRCPSQRQVLKSRSTTSSSPRRLVYRTPPSSRVKLCASIDDEAKVKVEAEVEAETIFVKGEVLMGNVLGTINGNSVEAETVEGQVEQGKSSVETVKIEHEALNIIKW